MFGLDFSCNIQMVFVLGTHTNCHGRFTPSMQAARIAIYFIALLSGLVLLKVLANVIEPTSIFDPLHGQVLMYIGPFAGVLRQII